MAELAEVATALRAGAKDGVRHLRLGQAVCFVWIVGAWTHAISYWLFALLTNFEAINIIAKFIAVIIVSTRSQMAIFRILGVRARTAWRRSKVDIGHLGLGLPVSSVRVIRTGAKVVRLWARVTLLRDGEAFNVLSELFASIILTWGDIGIIRMFIE